VKKREIILYEDDTLNKSIQVVYMSRNALPLVAQKAFNILLKNAYSDLGVKEDFTIPASVLYEKLGISPTNRNALKEAIQKLHSVAVEVDLLNDNRLRKKKKVGFKSGTLLAWADFDGSFLHYKILKEIGYLLKYPNVYAKIPLSNQQCIKSKYTQALFEIMYDIFRIESSVSYSKWIDVNSAKKIFGVPEDTPFKKLKAQVIKNAIKDLSDLFGWKIELEQYPKAKNVKHIRFRLINSTFDF
jgi:hypothetical protein